MSDSQRNSTSDRSSENGRGANRRNVLQGIGAAGVASAVMSGSAAAEGGESQRSRADVAAAQSDTEIPTSAQFWSFRENDLSVPEKIHEMEAAGYDHFEPYSISEDSDHDAILEAIDETGVTMASAHQGHEAILDDAEAVADLYSQYGEPTLIQAWWGDIDWTDETAVTDFATEISEAADLMSDHGMEVGYHNHDFEFQQISGSDQTGYDVFAQEVSDDVHLQIDAGWVLTGGEDPIEYIVEYADKVGSIHMKNMRDGEFVEIDEGDVGMRGVATAARNAADVDLLVYEHDAPEDPLESMETGGYWLNKLNKPWNPGGICAIPDADTHPAILHEP